MSKTSKLWPADRLLKSPEDVFAALGVRDLEDLGDKIEYSSVDVGPLDWDWEEADHDSVGGVALNSYIGAVHFRAELPLTVAELHAVLDTLRDSLEFRGAAAGLPTEDTEDEDPTATTRELADFFGVQLPEFTDALGGGWRAVDATGLGGFNEEPIRWFRSGSPLQALLGIGEDYATVGRPTGSDGGVGSSPLLEPEDTRDVVLRQPNTLELLAVQLRSI